MSSPSRQTLLDTTYRFISLFTQPFSPSAALGLRAPRCIHHIGPSVPNLTFTDNDTAVASWANLQWAFRNYRFTGSGSFRSSSSISNSKEEEEEEEVAGNASTPIVFVDVEARTTIFRVRGEADTVDGPYRHDIVFMLTMDAEGRRIEVIDEVCDSAYVAGWMAKFGDEQFKKRSEEWQAREEEANK
ncbi:hypothetical protein PFICI_02802 [Pestalotiopsis fici W106-1]|uniref:SnoaL-like domain-containing protein n=1 Tax=Pestalotiopsis fici (strain W106-1 / CGMCC3.15140) TaxID=1229662 RepID=W3XH85_PESFW|nr:uncharacterized protein PFICI_02802 [Pestalotiopsis fici W106-1]ETS84777.1 hypothetical protein PFICI_02802 [Pestalotiopsis fici W106-1]